MNLEIAFCPCCKAFFDEKLLLKQTITRNYKNIVSKSAAFISAVYESFQTILLINMNVNNPPPGDWPKCLHSARAEGYRA